MTPRTVNVICARAPRRIGCVPAVQNLGSGQGWYCSFCGARVKVVA